jgi:hypothetical protein
LNRVKNEVKMSVIVMSVIVSIAAIIGCLSYYISGPDNKVEEVCEAIIEKETGSEIDLSPSTPETKIELEQSPTVSPLAGVNGTSI